MSIEHKCQPDLGLRISVTERRLRFATRLSRLTGQPVTDAWRVFRPLPAPDGRWGVPLGPPKSR